MPFIEPRIFCGQHVTLEPLAHAHASEASDAVLDGELWKHWYTQVPSPDAMKAEIARRLDLQAVGSMLPFAVRESTGRFAGMTTYMNIDTKNRRVEIGSTWYRASAQRTGLNTEAKLLLLGHAFEDLNCIAVEFRTHWFNFQSRNAILRLGAKQDGVLRNHQLAPNGTLRDTVVFSILNCEWPTVKTHLRFQLDKARD